MAAPKLKAGTARDPRARLPHMTEEQVAAIETIVDPRYTPRFARVEFVNCAMTPDGETVKDAGRRVLAAANDRLNTAMAAKKTPENLRRAADLTAQVTEIEDAINENRFLFIVGEDWQPLTYFQCCVSHNPELKAKGVVKVKP